MTKVGIINLQGSVDEHYSSLKGLVKERNIYKISKSGTVPEMDKIIIPGGESTTILQLLKKTNIFEEIIEAFEQSKTIFGTCAGLISMAKERGGEISKSNQDLLGLMDIKVVRNAFGRQKESFEVPLGLSFLETNFPSVFIRAPAIIDYGSAVEVLGKYKNKVVAARQNNLLVTSFHPELVDDKRVFRYFLKID